MLLFIVLRSRDPRGRGVALDILQRKELNNSALTRQVSESSFCFLPLFINGLGVCLFCSHVLAAPGDRCSSRVAACRLLSVVLRFPAPRAEHASVHTRIRTIIAFSNHFSTLLFPTSQGPVF